MRLGMTSIKKYIPVLATLSLGLIVLISQVFLKSKEINASPGKVQNKMNLHYENNLKEIFITKNGKKRSLISLDSKIIIVNFWASWCPPCRAEHPTLLELSANGNRVAGINFRDEADAAVEYLVEEGDPFFATGFDPRGRTAINWGVTAPPETFIVGGDGTVLFRFAGPLIGSDYEQRFLPALADAMGG